MLSPFLRLGVKRWAFPAHAFVGRPLEAQCNILNDQTLTERSGPLL